MRRSKNRLKQSYRAGKIPRPLCNEKVRVHKESLFEKIQILPGQSPSVVSGDFRHVERSETSIDSLPLTISLLCGIVEKTFVPIALEKFVIWKKVVCR